MARLKDRRASGRIAGGTSFGYKGPLHRGPFPWPTHGTPLNFGLDLQRQAVDRRDPDGLARARRIARARVPVLAVEPNATRRVDVVHHRGGPSHERLRSAAQPVAPQEPLPGEVFEDLQAQGPDEYDQPPGNPEDKEGDEPADQEHAVPRASPARDRPARAACARHQ